MATTARLKNAIAFNLATGASVVIPHELSDGQKALAPDIIFIPSPDLSATADDVAVTLTNAGPALASSILVEAWHTIERAFGAKTNTSLLTKPYVVVSVEPGNAPPIPAWPAEFTTKTIFANVGGSDETGTGTEEKPYRTFVRAVRDVPYIVMPGYAYFIDVTGLGEETLPDGYSLPSWISGAANPDGIFAVNIQAVHELALSAAASTISAGTKNYDPATGDYDDLGVYIPDTGMFSVADPGKTWTPDALKGLFVYGTSSGDPTEVGLAGVIHANSATEIFITSNEGADWTFPFTIRKCSATLRGNGAGAFSGMLNCSFAHSLAIDGIAIIPFDTVDDTGWCQQGGYVWFHGSHLVNLRINDGLRFSGLSLCNLINPGLASAAYIQSSRIADAAVNGWTWLSRSANYGLNIFRGSCVDNCRTIRCDETTSVDSGGRMIGGSVMMSHCLLKNMIGDAIYWPGGNVSMKNVKIMDSVAGYPFPVGQDGNAVTLRGGVLAVLERVTGTGNAGVGVRLLDGAQAEIQTTTTVEGAGGAAAALQVGVLAAQAYPAAPFNVADAATFTRAFDPTF